MTEGDPLAMAMYALATLPLFHRLDHLVQQVWHVDDASAGGILQQLHECWNRLTLLGPQYSYLVNVSKTWLVVKEEHLSKPKSVFEDTNILITSQGKKYLSSAIGNRSFIESFAKRKIDDWTSELITLSGIAVSHPQAAYAAMTHGLISKWNYFSHTTPSISHLFALLEILICSKLIPALTGLDAPNDTIMSLLPLPTRFWRSWDK